MNKLYVFSGLLILTFWAGTEFANPNIRPWEYVKDLASLSIAIATLIIANKALNTWQKQHVYIERYRTVVELINLLVKIGEHLESLRVKGVAIIQLNIGHSDWESTAKNWPEARDAMRNSSYEFSCLVNRAKFILSKEELKIIESYKQEITFASTQYLRASEDIYNKKFDENNSTNKLEPQIKMPVNKLLNYLGTLIEKQKISN